MSFAIFRNNFVLFFLTFTASFGQVPDNVASIELGLTTFPIERPFTMSVVMPASENRITVPFPEIPGFEKKGVSTSISPVEINGKTIASQVVTQSYQALAPGRFRLPPFSIDINGESVHSLGAMLVVQPSRSAPANPTFNLTEASAGNAAFLSLRASRTGIFAGEGVALTLSFFVADNYPYELSFTGLDKQLQAIVKKIRPANSWEENLAITELKPIPVVINGKKFREFRIYQSVFFPLSNRDLNLPAVSLQLARPQPKIGPPTAQPETVVFTSKPFTIVVKPLPPHPLRGRVPVGTFALTEGLERQGVRVGQSVRYTFTITGEGNISTLPAPSPLSATPELDVFPPEERHTIVHYGNHITGHKTFSYFIVPHQNGQISLANSFQWIYFDPRTSQYDTLQSQIRLLVGSKKPATGGQASAPDSTLNPNEGPTTQSLYAGIETLDSTHQPVSISALVRAVANVLILVMLAGMVFIFFKRHDTGR